MRLKDLLILENVETLPIGELGALIFLKNGSKNELNYHDGVDWKTLNVTQLSDIEFNAIDSGNLAIPGIIYYKQSDNTFYKSSLTNSLEELVITHDEITLNISTTTTDTITLNGQELTVNLATPTTDGSMSKSDKTKLNNITDLGSGEIITTIERSNLHLQNTDVKLDEGNVDEVSSNEIRTHLDDDIIHITQNESDALVGTNGIPSATNKFLTDSDTRLSDFGNFLAYFIDSPENLTLIKEFVIGTYNNPVEFIVGRGDSTHEFNLVYTKSDIGVYTDVTSQSKIEGGTTYTFPNTNTNSAIYFSSDRVDPLNGNAYQMFTNIKMFLDTHGVLGTGSMVWEYWNGVSWFNVNCMLVDESGFYYQTTNNDFSDTNLDLVTQCYFNKDMKKDWTDTTDIGNLPNRKWIRLRIDSSITTAPIFEYTKIGTSRVEDNANGLRQYFDDARGQGFLPFSWSHVDDISGLSGMSDNDTFITKTMGLGAQNNKFNSGTNSLASFVTIMNDDVDTSCPLILNMLWFGDNDGNPSDYVEFDISYKNQTQGVAHYDTKPAAPNTDSAVKFLNVQVDVSTIINQTLFETNIALDISSYAARNFDKFKTNIIINIKRNGASDSYSGDITIINANMYYTSWCLNPPILLIDTIN